MQGSYRRIPLEVAQTGALRGCGEDAANEKTVCVPTGPAGKTASATTSTYDLVNH